MPTPQAWLGLCALALLANACRAAQSQRPPAESQAPSETTPADVAARPAPNVLFIAVDDLNDWVGVLGGHPQARTPNIDSLAERGVLFTNAHCAAPACAPSRASVMTGLRPTTTGLYYNENHWRRSPAVAKAQTLPMHFRNQGYRTLGAGKLFHAHTFDPTAFKGHSQPEAWDDYFPALDRQLADEAAPAIRPANTNVNMYGGYFDWAPLEIDDDQMGDGEVVRWAEGVLSTVPTDDRALFLGVGIYRPHVPWYVPLSDFQSFPIEEVQLPTVLPSDLSDVPPRGRRMTQRVWHSWLRSTRKWKAAVQAYLASVQFADRMVGRLIRALDAGPYADNTIIVLWSDHGYHLGEKEHWEKFALWEDTTHVPLLVVDPRPASSASSNRGERCDGPVSLLDIYPTLLSLCELPPPSQSLEGVDLSMQLAHPNQPNSRAVVTTQGPGNYAVRSQRHRYIRYEDGSEELYDHASDPHEWHNLAAEKEHAERIAELARWLPSRCADPAPSMR